MLGKTEKIQQYLSKYFCTQIEERTTEKLQCARSAYLVSI